MIDEKLAQKYDLPIMVKNTFGADRAIAQPIKYGANLIVGSATKWIGGHGTTLVGIIVDAGNYNWGNGKFPQFTEPSPSYHALVLNDIFGIGGPFGNIQFIIRVRVERGYMPHTPSITSSKLFLILKIRELIINNH